MDEGVDASVCQWQENVELPTRLLRQRGPQPELEHLPGRARLVARPRPNRIAQVRAVGICANPVRPRTQLIQKSINFGCLTK